MSNVAHVIRQLIELRDQTLADLRRKQYQLEGFDMAAKLIEENEAVEATKDPAHSRGTKSRKATP